MYILWQHHAEKNVCLGPVDLSVILSIFMEKFLGNFKLAISDLPYASVSK